MRTLVLSLFVAGLVVVFCFSGTAADKDLVLYLSFDEGAGDVVNDQSDLGNHGTLEGLSKPKWVDGQSGKALSYDGTCYVEVPHDDSLNMTTPHTISYWLKWGGTGLSWSPFISKTGGSDPADNFHTWVGSDKIWDYANGNMRVNADTPIELDSDKWVFLTTVHDGKQVHFYVNGVLDVSKDLALYDPNDTNLLIGDDGKGNFGNGIVDELLIFTRAMTVDEINTLMNEGARDFIAVEKTDKLTTTWGATKASR